MLRYLIGAGVTLLVTWAGLVVALHHACDLETLLQFVCDEREHVAEPSLSIRERLLFLSVNSSGSVTMESGWGCCGRLNTSSRAPTGGPTTPTSSPATSNASSPEVLYLGFGSTIFGTPMRLWAWLLGPAKVMAERLGHSSVLVTLDTYSHVSPAMDAGAAALIAGLIDGSLPR